jgi:iron complex outermembrane receptor protein
VVTLSADEIRTLPVQNMADLLACLPGVHLSRKGPMDTAYDISFRGGNFEQTLILIDGVPWNNPQTGHFNADLPLQLDDVASIQLIRGGNGARYGSAFAGAVNIVTRRRAGLTGSVNGGQYGLLAASLGGGVSLGRQLHLAAGLTHQQNDGFHPRRELEGRVFNTSLNWETNSLALRADIGRVHKAFGADGFYAPYPSWEESSGTTATLHGRLRNPSGRDYLRFSFSYQDHADYFELDRTRPDFFKNESDTRRFMVMAETNFTFLGMALGAGTDLTLDRMVSLAMGQPEDRCANLFLNGKWGRKKLTVDWGLRGEWWSAGLPRLVYYAGLAWQPDPVWLLKASLGRSTRRPSFTERFYQSPSNRGDENLHAEIGQNLEISLITPRSFGVFELGLFTRHQEGSIDWINRNPQGGTLWQAVNLAPYRVSGLELAYTVDLGRNRLQLAFEKTFCKGAPDIGYTSKYGFRIPDLVFRTTGLSHFGRRLVFSWTHQFKRLMADRTTAHLLDIQLQFKVSEQFSLLLLGQNLTNAQIEETVGVPISGRWLSAGIRYRL